MDKDIGLLAACGSGKNHSRNLHELISRQGRMLAVDTDKVTAPVRVINKGRPRRTNMDFTVLNPSSWLRYSLSVGGEAFLGGKTLDGDFRSMLQQFWTKYELKNPSFHLFQRPDYNLDLAGYCIPTLIHGDEGRGKAKRPIMVLSIQPLISWKGPGWTNTSGNWGK